MATMNVSLPDQMKEWVEAQARGGRYANASDYVRDLIRRDQEAAMDDARWWEDEVGKVYDRLKANPAEAIPAELVFARLRARHAKIVADDE
ncbi:MAG: type II toxin-antitoxin system ParD family antitoxin [Pseudomonadota bacterium]